MKIVLFALLLAFSSISCAPAAPKNEFYNAQTELLKKEWLHVYETCRTPMESQVDACARLEEVYEELAKRDICVNTRPMFKGGSKELWLPCAEWRENERKWNEM